MPKAKTAQSRAETTEQLAPSGAGNKENSLLQFDVRIQSIRPYTSWLEKLYPARFSNTASSRYMRL